MLLEITYYIDESNQERIIAPVISFFQSSSEDKWRLDPRSVSFVNLTGQVEYVDLVKSEKGWVLDTTSYDYDEKSYHVISVKEASCYPSPNME